MARTTVMVQDAPLHFMPIEKPKTFCVGAVLCTDGVQLTLSREELVLVVKYGKEMLKWKPNKPKKRK